MSSGIYLDGEVGLGSARLSIIDLSGGQQPIANEDGIAVDRLQRRDLQLRRAAAGAGGAGHRFRTRSDTEVILHLYEELGPGVPRTASTASSPSPSGTGRREIAVPRPRPPRHPAAVLHAVGRHASVFALRDQGAPRGPAGSAPDRPARRWTRSSPSGARCPPHGLRGDLRAAARPLPCRGAGAAASYESWLAADVPRADAAAHGGGLTPRSCASCWSTPRASGCGPTCRSAPT